MANALFLSIKYLRDNTPINANVDAKEIYPHAKTAEDTHLEPVIGTKLYTYLKNVVISSKASPPVGISTNDQTLLEYLRDALIWYTLYDALPFIHTKVRNIGVVSQSGENLETASDQRLAKLQKIAMDKAVIYINKVKRYLCEYDELYSEFKCDSWDVNPNLLTRDNSGIAFDRNINHDYIKKWFSE